MINACHDTPHKRLFSSLIFESLQRSNIRLGSALVGEQELAAFFPFWAQCSLILRIGARIILSTGSRGDLVVAGYAA